MVLNIQGDRLNEAIKCLKTKNIWKTNNSIATASMLVAGQTWLKKAEHKKKNEHKDEKLRLRRI